MACFEARILDSAVAASGLRFHCNAFLHAGHVARYAALHRARMSPASISAALRARGRWPASIAALLGRRLLQHVVRLGRPVARMADADAQAPVVVRAELRGEMSLQAVVPAMPPPSLSARSPGGEVELVVHDQDLLRLDLVEARERRTGCPERFMKVCGSSQQPGVRPARCRPALNFGSAQRAAARGRKALDEPEAGVVAGALVLRARIAEADDQLDHGLRRCRTLSFVASAKEAPGFLSRPSRLLGGLLGRRRACLPSARRPAARRPARPPPGFHRGGSSSSATSFGRTRSRPPGSRLACTASSTPFGSLRSCTWIECPTRAAEVDLDELGQVVGQAGDVELVQDVVDHAVRP